MKNLIASLFVLPLLLSCSTSEQPKGTPPDVNDLADRYVSNYFHFHPEWGTFYGIENANDSGLSNITPEGLASERSAEDSLMAELEKVDVNNLDQRDLATYSVLKTTLESNINVRVCNKHLWNMDQMGGFHIWFNYIANTQPVGDSVSRAHALARWKQIPQYIRNDLENNKTGIESGYALPKVAVERVIEQLEQLIAAPLTSNRFYRPALRDSSEAFANQMGSIVTNEIMPEIITYKRFLEEVYLDKAREELSISSIPNGSECYVASLAKATTLSELPETIFQWGEEAIALREKSIRQIGSQVYGETEIPAIQAAFKADKSNYFNSREEILQSAQAAMTRAKESISEYFGLLPKADVELEAIPAIEEKSGYSRYLPASDDGSRPAVYMQQTYLPETRTRGSVETLAFHETYPGHHLQRAISRELVQSHPITKYVGNAGFAEGWARYTQMLADEMGLYSSDKCRLAALMGLPTGMVVDPGIHFKNWTRDEAIDYTLRKQTSLTKADAERYVDRISVLPGTVTTYGVGEMHFRKLRALAEETLGEEFDIKEFHDQCLQNGTVPLDFVNNQVTGWINSKSQ